MSKGKGKGLEIDLKEIRDEQFERDTAQWDEMGFSTGVMPLLREYAEGKRKADYQLVRLLAYIQWSRRWKELPGYEEGMTFREFVEVEVALHWGGYMNMRAMAMKYGEADFNRWGYKNLKRMDSTKDPKEVLGSLNERADRGEQPGAAEVKAEVRKAGGSYEWSGTKDPRMLQRVRCPKCGEVFPLKKEVYL